jgi:hypothetical protein
MPYSFWHPLRVERIRLLIDADIEADPKMMVPGFRKQTRHLTKILLISRFYLEDTCPDNNPTEVWYNVTTTKIDTP